MHIIIMFILMVSFGVLLYFVGPLFINDFILDEMKPNIDIKQIEMKIASLEELNANLKTELSLTDTELSQMKIAMESLSQENTELKTQLIEQIEKDKKNISQLFD